MSTRSTRQSNRKHPTVLEQVQAKAGRAATDEPASQLLLFTAATGTFSNADTSGKKRKREDNEDESKEEEPKEPPIFQPPEREQRKLDKLFTEYLRPGKKPRVERLSKLEGFVEDDVGGHSPMEDVAAFARIANRARMSRS